MRESDDEKTGMLSRETDRRMASTSFASLGDWLCTAAIWAAGHFADQLPPFERELRPQLHDPTISYHHTPAHEQQFPTWLLWRVSLYIPLAAVAAVAMVPPRPLAMSRLGLLSELWLGLLSSVGLAFTLVCLVKCAVGRLRPDFLARCMAGTDGKCTGDPAVIVEGRKSFPSGHSALSFSGLFFVSLVLAARLAPMGRRWGTLWKLCVVAMPWLLALQVALSRIADYWHHWEDVLIGSLIGHLAAYAAFIIRFPAPWVRGLIPHALLPAEGVSELAEGNHRSSPPDAV